MTAEQIPVKGSYTEKDLEAARTPSTMRPASPPFLRGPYSTMYVMRPWTIRQYAGFSTAEESNASLPPQPRIGGEGLGGVRPRHPPRLRRRPSARGGRRGQGGRFDMLRGGHESALRRHSALDQMSVSMTMNGAVLPVLAFFTSSLGSKGVRLDQMAGTIQNDILKEFMVRNTYIYPPEFSMRIIADIFEYTAKNMPKFNSISISGYHMQEAGRRPTSSWPIRWPTVWSTSAPVSMRA